MCVRFGGVCSALDKKSSQNSAQLDMLYTYAYFVVHSTASLRFSFKICHSHKSTHERKLMRMHKKSVVKIISFYKLLAYK